MTSRESKIERGRRVGRALVRQLVGEARSARMTAGVSQDDLAAALGWSQSDLSRFERLARIDSISIVAVAEVVTLLGLQLSASLHATGDPIRDQGHQALSARFRALLAPAFRVAAEVPLPSPGDGRSWDLFLRLDTILIGVELETRIRDVQWLVRRIRERERDGGSDHVLLVLSASRANRQLLPQLLEALGDRFATSPRRVLEGLTRRSAAARQWRHPALVDWPSSARQAAISSST